MSVIAVQAAAGREIVHANPDKAAEVFAGSRRSGASRSPSCGACSASSARPATSGTSLSPQPGIADIAAAVDAVVGQRACRRAGHRG